MSKLLQIICLCSLLVLFVSPKFVYSEERKSYYIMENIKTLSDFLKEQDYFENITQICHEEECFAIDIHDLKHSLQSIEQKVLTRIQVQYGKEVALQTELKGFSITRILTR